MLASQSDAEVLGLYRPAAYFGLECCAVSTTALVVYDWLVTLSREVDLFWTGKARPLSAILYFANKYLNVLPYVMTGVQMAPMSDKRCVCRPREQFPVLALRAWRPQLRQDNHCVSHIPLFILYPTSSVYCPAGLCVDSFSMAGRLRPSPCERSSRHEHGGVNSVVFSASTLQHGGV
ncbi:hypothetical protein V8D89_004421 [Ganoderma adspersum]